MIRYSLALVASLSLAILFPGLLVRADEQANKSTWVTSIAPLGDSGQFVASTANGLLLRESSVVSFDANRYDELTPLYSHPAAVWCVDASSDGKSVVSVDYRGNLIVFDTASNQATTHEKAFERWCQAMILSPDNKTVIAGNEAGKVMLWDLASSKISQSAELDGNAITGVALSPDGSQLAASDGAGHVHLLKYPGLEPIGEIKVSEQTVWCVVFSNDGKQLFVGGSDRNLYRCDPKPEAKPESVAKGTDWITQLAISGSGQIAAAEVGGRLHFPSLGGTDSMDAQSGVWALCWNGNEQVLAGTRKDGVVAAGRSWKWTEPVKPAEEKPAEEKPAEEKPAEEKPAEEKPAEEKPAEEKE